MFMRRLMICFCSFLCYAAQAEKAGPNLGKPAPEDLVKSWNIDVFPNGEGLPEGSGNAVKGKQVYEAHCLSCHGSEGTGGSADELAGARHSLTDNPPDKTIGTYWPYATTIFDFTRRAMPLNAPGSLSHDQLYAVTAYLLYLNSIIKETDIMNAKKLPEVKMPNREGFIRIDTE
jgi:hypothetical protein